LQDSSIKGTIQVVSDISKVSGGIICDYVGFEV
jgi:hypothetical protein